MRQLYLQDRRPIRCPLSEYVEMPQYPTEDDLCRAVMEVAFTHNVNVERIAVDVDLTEQFASWGECSMSDDA